MKWVVRDCVPGKAARIVILIKVLRTAIVLQIDNGGTG